MAGPLPDVTPLTPAQLSTTGQQAPGLALVLPGYSRDIISRNIAELRRSGKSPRQATKLAYDQARLTGGVQVKEPKRR